MTNNSCHVVVGRLLEIRLRDGYRSIADIDEMAVMLSSAIAQASTSKPLVIVADWRACKVLSPSVSSRATAMMKSTNDRVERSAILHGAEHPTSVMQLFRLVKETEASHRRLFTDASALHDWVGEILDADERNRLREFLAER